MATSDRPVSSESVCSLSSFQNRDIEFNQVSTSERRLGDESGSPRCVFSYPHSPSITSLSSFCLRRHGLPVPSLSFWPECQSVCVYSDVKNSTQSREAPRYSGSRLPGRLVTTFCLRNPVMASQQKASEDYSGPRLHSQLGEVRTSSSQGFLFPGARFKLAQALMGPSQDNIASILQALAKLVGARQASARQLYSILGQMESMASLLPLGRAFKRSLQWELKERWCQRLALWDTNILLGQWFVSAVAPWMDLDFLTSMSPLHHPSPQLHLFTDSSLEGWGAHMDNHMASGFWSIIYKKQHINVLEMKAVLLALQAFAVHIKGHSVLLATDNITVAAYINKQGGDSFPDLVQPSSGSCRVVCKEQGPFEGQVSTRPPECLSRLPIEKRGSCSDRMVAQSESGVSDISCLGQSTHRSVCHTSEQETSPICISCSRAGGICHRVSAG